MKKLLTLFTILSLGIIINAQALGDWTSHTPGKNIISVDVMHNNIYAATPYDIFYFNTDDNSMNNLSKINGLSDMGISMLKYSEPYDILFVGYTNTNIDIIDRNGNITNNSDIYNKYILGNKTINNVFFKDNFAYVCCSFGIVVIDMRRNEVKDTYIIGNNGSYMNVNDLTLNNGIFYAATESGIYYANANSTNLADYSQWKHYKYLTNASKNFSHVEIFNGNVVASYSDNSHNTDKLYELYDTVSWSYFINENNHTLISEMRVCDDKLILTGKNNIEVYDTDKNIIMTLKNNLYPQSTTYDKARNCYWLGSLIYSLAKITDADHIEYIRFNGPFSEKVFSLTSAGEDVWLAHGGYTSTWAPTWNNDGFSYYSDKHWSYINSWNTSAFDTIFDITYVKRDPVSDNILYVASYSRGLVVMENYKEQLPGYNKVKIIYDSHNSSLGKHLQLTDYTFITGIDFDSHNNMWVANSGTDKMLSVRKTDGTWQAFNIGNVSIGKLMVDKNDNKWIFQRGGTFAVFNGNMTKSVNTSANTGNLPGTANCFATDKNGTVWIGTTDGVALFYDSKKIFNNSTYSCSRILIPRNDGSGQADYLLSGQSVLSIAVDGANNLWFGTNNGVIHTSNDGQTTYHHFTTDNSPLFSNAVKDIAIDDDGNVYFATDNGVISYKGEATKGYESNTNVIVYPNPVRPEHRGLVGIKGLVYDALVKITTTNGDFVTHLKAQGGQAVWDCTDIKGNKVEPGIYLIFVSDESGSETYATKVLIMK